MKKAKDRRVSLVIGVALKNVKGKEGVCIHSAALSFDRVRSTLACEVEIDTDGKVTLSREIAEQLEASEVTDKQMIVVNQTEWFEDGELTVDIKEKRREIRR